MLANAAKILKCLLPRKPTFAPPPPATKPPFRPPPFGSTDPCLGREAASVVDMPSSGRYLPTERDFDSNFVSQNRVKRQTKVISTPRYGGRTQAGPVRKVKQEQEENYRNRVPYF